MFSAFFKKANIGMIEKKQQLINSVAEAELVLVGIGTEFAVEEAAFFQWDLYKKWKEADREEKCLWMEPFLKRIWLKKQESVEIQKAYASLAKLLEEKNYFVVTLCTDDLIYESDLKKERIVAPCGSMNRLQCQKGCTKELYFWDKDMEQQLTEAVLAGSPESCKPFVCPHCNAILQWNTVCTQIYNEDGYLPMWEKYTKWIQGMPNRKVCIVEAGVDFTYPSVIRWPFEKMAYFNKKASFYRIHHTWYQMTEELKDKGNAICSNSRDFFVNLFV